MSAFSGLVLGLSTEHLLLQTLQLTTFFRSIAGTHELYQYILINLICEKVFAKLSLYIFGKSFVRLFLKMSPCQILCATKEDGSTFNSMWRFCCLWCMIHWLLYHSSSTVTSDVSNHLWPNEDFSEECEDFNFEQSSCQMNTAFEWKSLRSLFGWFTCEVLFPLMSFFVQWWVGSLRWSTITCFCHISGQPSVAPSDSAY